MSILPIFFQLNLYIMMHIKKTITHFESNILHFKF